MDAIHYLSDFVKQEMHKRQMSALAFAELIGVSHTTINKFLDFDTRDKGYPSIDFLVKLAAVTHTDIRYLIALVVPDTVLFDAEVSQEYMHLSKQIELLKPAYQRIIKLIIETELGNDPG